MTQRGKTRGRQGRRTAAVGLARTLASTESAAVVGTVLLLAAFGAAWVAPRASEPPTGARSLVHAGVTDHLAAASPVPGTRGPGSGASGSGAWHPPAALAVPVPPSAPGELVAGDDVRPDPFVLRTAEGYYLYSGQVIFSTDPIMVSFSTTLGQWPTSQPAMFNVPRWAVDGFTWSPDVLRLGSRYVMYFDALARPGIVHPGFGGQCIGSATARSPFGPFLPAEHPLVCQYDHQGSIDPRTFTDAGGHLWLLWKSDDNALPDTTDPSHLFSQRLSGDGLRLTGPRHELLSADQPWERRIIEAPDLVDTGGTYWLFYSGGWFNQPFYAEGLARCAGPAGPCADVDAKPWLTSNAQGQGPGEASLFRDHAGQWWMSYSPSAWGLGATTDGVPGMPVALTRVTFTPAGPELSAPGAQGAGASPPEGSAQEGSAQEGSAQEGSAQAVQGAAAQGPAG